MSPKVQEALDDLIVYFLHGAKVFLVYILPSALVAILISPDFQHLFVTYPLVNMFWASLAAGIKDKLPEDHKLQKML